MDPASPRLVVTDGGRIVVARVAGCDRLTEDTMGVLGPALAALSDPPGGGRVVVDLADVLLVGGAALGALAGLNRRVREGGGRLTLTGVRPAVEDVFAASHLGGLLDRRACLVLPARRVKA